MKNNLRSLQTLLMFGVVGISSAFGANTLHETAGGPDTAETVLNTGGALMISDGTALPGATVGINTRIVDDAPLYAGAELGTFLATGSNTYALFPLMGDLYYQFQPVAVVHPLVGVMAGPVLSTGGGISTARLGLIFRPGINFELGRRAALNVEPRFGVIGSEFVFLPQVGAVFGI